MVSLNIYKPNKGPASHRRTNATRGGVTITEIIIVLGILSMVLSFGLVVDLRMFKNDNFQTEQSKIISILERARSSAMANMSDSSHGVCYDPATDSYVIFKGNICTNTDSQLILANTLIAENSGTIFPALVFNRLSGNATPNTIHLTDGITSTDITINNEGTINW